MSALVIAAAIGLCLAALVRVPSRGGVGARARARRGPSSGDPPGGRGWEVRGRPSPGDPPGGRGRDVRVGSPSGDPPRGRELDVRRGLWRLRLRGRAGAAGAADLGVLVTEVATRLRSGASAEAAWAQTFDRAGLGGTGVVAGGVAEAGVPPQLARLEEASRAPRSGAERVAARWTGAVRAGGGRRAPAAERAALAATVAERAALAATVAACRLTHELGAPLADVLERCAHGITEAAQAQDARRIALAGPRSTARLLGWLPVAGLLLGTGMGADPAGTLLDGSWGSASFLAGVGLLVVGQRWTRALVASAERGGEDG